MTTAETGPRTRRGHPRRALLPGAARRGDPARPREPPGHVRRLPRAQRASRRLATSTATSTSARSSRSGATSGRWRAARSRSPRSATRSLYEIADWSLIVVRTAPGHDLGLPQLVPPSRHPAAHPLGPHQAFRCPYHGFSWNLDGSLREIPSRVGLPADRRGDVLPARGAGRDVGRVRLRQHRPRGRHRSRTTSRTCPRHFAQWPLDERYLSAHVVRTMPCNWKVALEAFIEAYHTMAVHPQLLTTAADSLTEYDVYGPHVSRMITAVGISSEHLDRQLDDVEIVRAMLGSKDAEVAIEPGSSARQVLGERVRASLGKRTGARLLERHRRRAPRRHRVLRVPELHAVGRLPDRRSPTASAPTATIPIPA